MSSSGHVAGGLKKVVVATTNAGKILEIDALFNPSGIEVVAASDLGQPPQIIEDGLTFEANARKKARTIADWSGEAALADDSGLEVDALDGKPGVWSARFAGSSATDDDNISLLLEKLLGTPIESRSARFRCSVVLAMPDGGELVASGVCEGYIAKTPEGSNGFGYDPVFVEVSASKTFGTLSADYKNRVSHRARALRALVEQITSQ